MSRRFLSSLVVCCATAGMAAASEAAEVAEVAAAGSGSLAADAVSVAYAHLLGAVARAGPAAVPPAPAPPVGPASAAAAGKPAPAASSLPLGRLFFTPEERAAIDAGRRPTVAPAPAAADFTLVELQGRIRSRSGSELVWVNGLLQGPAEAPLAVGLKSGEAWDALTQSRIDRLGAGRIVIHQRGSRAGEK